MKRVHFVAIGGTGMGSLAGLLKARGWEVTGSDEGLYPPMSTALEGWGIPVSLGFRPENVLDTKPDLVVIGNAVRTDNPEAQAVLDAGLAYRSFPDALFELAMADKHSVVVAGTHGKTTLTSLITVLLMRTGQDPRIPPRWWEGSCPIWRVVFARAMALTSSSRGMNTTRRSSTRRRNFSITIRKRSC